MNQANLQPANLQPANLQQPVVKRFSSITLWGIYSVWRRHAKVYQKTWLVNFLSPVTEPIFYLLAFGYGFSPLIKDLTYQGQQVSYLTFIAPGIISLGLVFQPFFEGAYGSFTRINYQKTWQSMMTAPISYAEVFLGDWLWAATKGMSVATATAVVATVLKLYHLSDLFLALPIMLLGTLSFAAMGMLTAACIRYADQVNAPVFWLVIPMCSLSGVYFPRESLPPILRLIAAPLPLSSVVDLMRSNISLPALWWLNVLWLVVFAGSLAMLAARLNYRKLVS
jgi:lipooligosaccharide transport system permease protein